MKIIDMLVVVLLFFVCTRVFAEDQCIPEERWLLPASGETYALHDFLPVIKDKRVVLLGEHHANAAHHQWQSTIIKHLFKVRPQLMLGLEVFPRRLQPVLDQWVQGTMSKTQFLTAIDWDSIWGYELSHYMPLFEFAQQNGIPMIALNVDKKLTAMVRENGWQAVPVDQREGVLDPAAPLREYVKNLALSYQGHGRIQSGKARNLAFLRFVEQQLLWDGAMADAIVNAVENNSESMLVAMMGSWHIIRRHGVPHQLQAKGVKDSLVLVPWDNHLDCGTLTADFADAVYGTLASVK